MNRKIITVLIILFLVSGFSLFADVKESDLYVKTIYIVKVFNDNLGFRVDYQTSNMELHSIYMPQKWFGKAAGYGEVVYGNHPSAPYLSVWYKDGKVDHFRLYLKKDYSDPSWGDFKVTGDNEDLFQVDELTIVY